MSSGKFRVDTKQIQRILTETIITLCKSTLDYDMEMSIKGILGITLDHEDILLVDIKEIIKGEQLLCKKAMADSSLFPHPDGWNTSTPSGSREPPSKRARAALEGDELGSEGEGGRETPVPEQRKVPEGRSRRVKREPMKVVVIEDKDVMDGNKIAVSSDNKRSLLNPINQGSPGGHLSGDFTLLGVPTRLSSSHENSPSSSSTSTPGRGMTLPTRILGTAYQTNTTPSPGGGKNSAFPIQLGTRSAGRKPIVAPTLANKPHNTSLVKATSPNRAGVKQPNTPGSSGKKYKPVKKHKCPDCSFSSDRRFNLERHMRQHTGGGVVCFHCGRAFCDDYYLKNNHLPKCTANPDSEVNQGRPPNSEPVDLSLSDLSNVGLALNPLQIVHVESMAGKTARSTSADDREEEEEEEGMTSQEEDEGEYGGGQEEVTSPARNLRSSDHSPVRASKRKSANPSSLSGNKAAKSITDLLGNKKDDADAVNNNETEGLYDPELKIKDEPLDT